MQYLADTYSVSCAGMVLLTHYYALSVCVIILFCSSSFCPQCVFMFSVSLYFPPL